VVEKAKGDIPCAAGDVEHCPARGWEGIGAGGGGCGAGVDGADKVVSVWSVSSIFEDILGNWDWGVKGCILPETVDTKGHEVVHGIV